MVTTRRHRPVLLACASVVVLWPAYHVLVAGNSVGASKHAALAVVVAAPAAAAGLDHLTSRLSSRAFGVTAAVLAAALLLPGLAGMQRLDSTWADRRPVADFLAERVGPQDDLLVGGGWELRAELLRDDVLESPWQVVDAYGLANGAAPEDLCAVEWLVDETAGITLPRDVVEEYRRCPGVTAVLRDDGTALGVSDEQLAYATYDVSTVVYRSTAGETR